MKFYENCEIKLINEKLDVTALVSTGESLTFSEVPVGNICFNINGESYECKNIKSLQEIIEKLEAYDNRDEYVRTLEAKLHDAEDLVIKLGKRMEKYRKFTNHIQMAFKEFNSLRGKVDQLMTFSHLVAEISTAHFKYNEDN